MIDCAIDHEGEALLWFRCNIHASLRLSDTLDFMHVDHKVMVMIFVGCVLDIARSTGTPITH